MMSHRPALVARVPDDPIVDAARRVMEELGPRRLTLAEVARRADVSRMTVYRRYEGVGQLVSAVLTAEMQQVLVAAVARSGGAHVVREEVVALAVDIVEALSGHTLLQRVIEVDPESLLPLLVSRIGSGQRLLQDALAARLGDGMAARGGDGSVRDGDPAAMALVVVALAQPFVVWLRPMSEEHPAPALFDELRIALDGYLQPRPPKEDA
jgi:AcrR family transcriptional regulator